MHSNALLTWSHLESLLEIPTGRNFAHRSSGYVCTLSTSVFVSHAAGATKYEVLDELRVVRFALRLPREQHRKGKMRALVILFITLSMHCSFLPAAQSSEQ